MIVRNSCNVPLLRQVTQATHLLGVSHGQHGLAIFSWASGNLRRLHIGDRWVAYAHRFAWLTAKIQYLYLMGTLLELDWNLPIAVYMSFVDKDTTWDTILVQVQLMRVQCQYQQLCCLGRTNKTTSFNPIYKQPDSKIDTELWI